MRPKDIVPPPKGTEQSLVLQNEREHVRVCLEPLLPWKLFYHRWGSSHFVNWGTEIQIEQGSFKVTVASVDCHLDRTQKHLGEVPLGLPLRNCLDGVLTEKNSPLMWTTAFYGLGPGLSKEKGAEQRGFVSC